MKTISELLAMDPASIPDVALEGYVVGSMRGDYMAYASPITTAYAAAYREAYELDGPARRWACAVRGIYGPCAHSVGPQMANPKLHWPSEWRRGTCDTIRVWLQATRFLHEVIAAAKVGTPENRMPQIPRPIPASPFTPAQVNAAAAFDLKTWCRSRPELLDLRRVRIVNGSLRIRGFGEKDRVVLKRHQREVIDFIESCCAESPFENFDLMPG
jgi:hypothetical protein